MDLHLHLSYAFRALDRNWGQAVDLDCSADLTPSVPAVIDRPAVTFSSEEYLTTIKRARQPRPAPYYVEDQNKRKNIKKRDSFSNISLARIPSSSDLGSLSTDSDCPVDGAHQLYGDEEILSTDEKFKSWTSTVDHFLQTKKKSERDVLKQLKKTALSLVEKRPWKKSHR